MKNKILIPLFIASLIFAAVPSAALAQMSYTFSFTCITNNNPANCATGESQLQLDITDITDGIKFDFINLDVPESKPSSITAIYFDDPTNSSGSSSSLMDYSNVTFQPSTDDVAFSPNASPSNLPGGGGSLDFTADYSAGSDSPDVPQHGVNPGESLYVEIKFADPTNTSSHLAAAIASGSLSIGLHMQAIGSGGSEAFIIRNTPSEGPLHTPEPTTMLLLGTGLVGVAGAARRRKKLQ